MTIRVARLRLQAFRAYPQSCDFPFPEQVGGSVLIFAPNGYGKSSITDAFEFLLNPDATLDRLGLRDAEMNSGRRPLRNTYSTLDKSLVELKIVDSLGAQHVGHREVRDFLTPVPGDLDEFARSRIVEFIVRGPDLREIIYKTTPRERYNELARYVNAERLAELQVNIRSIELQIKRDAESHDNQWLAIKTSIRSLTNSVEDWDESKILGWLAELLRPYDLIPASLEPSDPFINQLEERAANERSTLAQEQHRRQIKRIDEILRKGEEDRLAFLEPLAALEKATDEHRQAATITAQASSRHLIDQAISLLDNPQEYPGACPVCGTEYGATPFGSRAGVVAHLTEMRTQLTGLRSADDRLSTAKRAWQEKIGWLADAIRQVSDAAPELKDELLSIWTTCQNQLSANSIATLDTLIGALENCRTASATALASAPAYTPVFAPLLEKVKKLLELRERVGNWKRLAERRQKLIAQLANARILIDHEAHTFISAAVASVEADVIAFYSAVQEFAPVPIAIHLNLMDSSNADARGLELLIDFPNAPSAKPRAFLSDSQVNTLALGLRLSLIRKFNPDLPFAVLDDVVTSYDADYRRQIAKVLLGQFADIQLVVLTHDEQFMREMRDRIAGECASRWRVRQIIRYRTDTGPELMDAPTSEAEIEGRLRGGQSAANQIRQYVERWLMRIGEEIGAKTVIRRSAEWSHRELIDAVVDAAKGYGIGAVLDGDSELRGLISELQSNSILNLGSHGGENPYRTGAAGDEQSLWADIKKLVALFKCAECGRGRFKFDVLAKKASCQNCGRYLDFTKPGGESSQE